MRKRPFLETGQLPSQYLRSNSGEGGGSPMLRRIAEGLGRRCPIWRDSLSWASPRTWRELPGTRRRRMWPGRSLRGNGATWTRSARSLGSSTATGCANARRANRRHSASRPKGKLPGSFGNARRINRVPSPTNEIPEIEGGASRSRGRAESREEMSAGEETGQRGRFRPPEEEK